MPTTIPLLPPPPNRATDDPTTFSNKADAFNSALPGFGTAVAARGVELDAAAASAEGNANVASVASLAAVGAANYRGDYQAGTTYLQGQAVSLQGVAYVAKTTTTGNAPPNSTFWFQITPVSAAYTAF